MAKRTSITKNPRKRNNIKGRAVASGALTTLVGLVVAVAYFLIDVPDAPAPGSGGSVSAAERAMLEGLDIRGRAPMTGYDRDLFGSAWADDVSVEFGHNGCDTRNDILRRDLTDLQIRPGTRDCLVEKGTLRDPFSAETINFVRGQATSSQVQIDHLVPLADAWQKGAQQWDEQTRKDFANDPDNLLAVKGSLNSQKGASDAATWLPPNLDFRCDYAKSIITVKNRYGIWVTQAESDALAVQLDTCSR